jgi:hypothetical protein
VCDEESNLLTRLGCGERVHPTSLQKRTFFRAQTSLALSLRQMRLRVGWQDLRRCVACRAATQRKRFAEEGVCLRRVIVLFVVPGLNEAAFVREDDGLDPVAEVELLQDARDVRLGCVFADDEFGCDLRVRPPAGNEQ